MMTLDEQLGVDLAFGKCRYCGFAIHADRLCPRIRAVEYEHPTLEAPRVRRVELWSLYELEAQKAQSARAKARIPTEPPPIPPADQNPNESLGRERRR